jgi:hypothetical protein
MQGRAAQLACLVGVALFVFAPPAHSQAAQGEMLSGPDSHGTGLGPHGHLFGDWGGEDSPKQPLPKSPLPE